MQRKREACGHISGAYDSYREEWRHTGKVGCQQTLRGAMELDPIISDAIKLK